MKVTDRIEYRFLDAEGKVISRCRKHPSKDPEAITERLVSEGWTIAEVIEAEIEPRYKVGSRVREACSDYTMPGTVVAARWNPEKQDFRTPDTWGIWEYDVTFDSDGWPDMCLGESLIW